MCKTLGVSHAAYYKWLHREVPEQELDNRRIAVLIREYDERFGHILGYRRMTLWINHFNGTDYKEKRIHRIMKIIGVHAIIRAKRKQYEHATPETVAENILKRDFHACRPNEKWTTDVTEFKIPEVNKKLYLSAIFDLYDRTPVSYVLSTRNDNALVFRTFDQAIAANPDATPLFHSDRGAEFGDPDSLENGIEGIVRTSIYYCDAMRSCQKPGVENVHTMLRMVLPKKTSFEFLTQWDVNLIVNHINSTPRKSLDGKTAYQVAEKTLGEDVLKKIQLKPIPPDEVNLTPKLIRYNR